LGRDAVTHSAYTIADTREVNNPENIKKILRTAEFLVIAPVCKYNLFNCEFM
jgi:hypothetical protein